jgi:hypothetical protein
MSHHQLTLSRSSPTRSVNDRQQAVRMLSRVKFPNRFPQITNLPFQLCGVVRHVNLPDDVIDGRPIRPCSPTSSQAGSRFVRQLTLRLKTFAQVRIREKRRDSPRMSVAYHHHILRVPGEACVICSDVTAHVQPAAAQNNQERRYDEQSLTACIHNLPRPRLMVCRLA